MKFLNRFSLHIHFKRPYLEWYNGLFPEESFASVQEINQAEKTTYLIPVFDNDEEIEDWLKENFEQFFIDELFAVSMNNEHWPKDISWENFNEWFDVDVAPLVVDYGDGELIDDSDGISGFWEDENEEDEEEFSGGDESENDDLDFDSDDKIRRLPHPPKE